MMEPLAEAAVISLLGIIAVAVIGAVVQVTRSSPKGGNNLVPGLITAVTELTTLLKTHILDIRESVVETRQNTKEQHDCLVRLELAINELREAVKQMGDK